MSTNIFSHNWGSENINTKQAAGEIVSSDASVIIVGPPRLKDFAASIQTSANANEGIVITPTTSVPIEFLGQTTMVDFRRTKPNQMFQEIGSRRVYPISQKPRGVAGSLRTVMVYNKSLLKALYGEKYRLTNDTAAYQKTPRDLDTDGINWENFLSGDKPTARTANDNPRGWFGLQSRIYTSHIGLGFLGVSNRDRSFGATYIEDVLIESHISNMSSEQNLMMEVVSFQGGFEKPLDITIE